MLTKGQYAQSNVLGTSSTGLESIMILTTHVRTPHPREPKPRPFQEIAIDFCTYGGHQFVIQIGQRSSTCTCTTSHSPTFCRSGAPDAVWSDQGPQFTSQKFSRESNPTPDLIPDLIPTKQWKSCKVHELGCNPRDCTKPNWHVLCCNTEIHPSRRDAMD